MRRLLPLAACALLAPALAFGGCGDEDGDDDSAAPLVLERAGEPPGEAPPPTFPATATANTVRVAGRDAVEDAAGVASAVFPATDNATRPDAVVLVDQDDWRGGIAASVLAADPIGAPVLLTDGEELPAVTSGTLARLDPRGAELAQDAQVIRVGDSVARPEDRRSTLIEGADPFTLAAEIDRFSAAAAGEPSESVVIASADDADFAMPAAAWAARSGDSVLFSERNSLPRATARAIEEHQRPDLYLLGPESVISDEVERELGDLGGDVTRIAGDTAVETAIEFARYSDRNFGWGLTTPGHNFTLASTSRPLDAAAAAALATNGTFAPLLLTDDALELPRPLRGYLLDVQPGFEDNPNRGVYNRVWVLGDQDAVSLTVQAEVDRLSELIPVQIEGARSADATPAEELEGPGSGAAGDGGGSSVDSAPRGVPGAGDLPDGPGRIPAPRGSGVPPDG